MPEPTLETTALRYAAGELTSAECTAFEARLAADQEARDAVAEAIRLSAAALHQAPPGPDRSFRAAIRERLVGWTPAWLRRRAYRGHPLTWAALGAAAVAACTLIGLALAEEGRPAGGPELASPPPGLMAEPFAAQSDSEAEWIDGESVAEIWADLSTAEQIERMHEEEQKWRQKLRDANILSGRAVPASEAIEPRVP